MEHTEHRECTEELLEEILEILWTELEEGGRDSIPHQEIVLDGRALPEETLAELMERGLARMEGGELFLTDAGFEESRRTIRRHRLSERLFSDVLAVGREEEVENAACRFEHMLIKPELEEKICTLLGHPKTCPHSRPIPMGSCCQRAELEVDQEVAAMSQLRQGESGSIAYVATGDSEKLKKIMAMGILPGVEVSLVRRYPSFVFKVGFSQYAVDEEMADAIFVRRKAPLEG